MLLDEQSPPYVLPVLFEPIVMTKKESIVIEGFGTRIDSFVKLEGGISLHIGRGVHIASFAHVGIGGGETILEDYCAVASGGKVISGSNQVDGLSMSATAPAEMQVVTASKTRIGKFACVLTSAVVLPGVTLHEGAVLAAGAVATKDIPAWEIWGGVPARFLAKREVK
jgi:acetyltransferase-like isoleucine patch superfamily enzyme